MLTTHLVSARARGRARGRVRFRGWVRDRVGVGVGVSAFDALVSRVADVRALSLRDGGEGEGEAEGEAEAEAEGCALGPAWSRTRSA